MLDLTRHPRLLKLLARLERMRRGSRLRSGATKAAGKHRAAFYDKVWRDAACAIGASVESLGHGILEITCDGRRTRLMSNLTPVDDPVTLEIAGNKPLCAKLLTDRGIPTPRHATFTLSDLKPALQLLEQSANRPCVVKPAAGTGAGHGVTAGVTSPKSLARAAAYASAFGPELLIEEQFTGDNLRLLYLDGEFLDAIHRRPPTVVGDGLATIHQLVDAANAERVRVGFECAQALLTIDDDMRQTLTTQKLTLSSIPAKDQRVTLKTVVNENCAQDNVVITDRVCDSVIKAGAAAASAVGAKLAGVDVITRDPSLPLAEAGGVVLEVNTTPGLYYHYQTRATPCPVAQRVLEYLFDLDRGQTNAPRRELKLNERLAAVAAVAVGGVRHA
jgi:cyanophycin synthetase